MPFDSLGAKRSPEEVASAFEVAVSTVLRYPMRYGGVRFGRRCLFFDKLIARAVENAYASQIHEEGSNRLARARAAQRAGADEGIPDPEGRTGLGNTHQGGGNNASGVANDPFDLLA